ncbi:hypothetical protein GH810_12815 [Acetobacterium paludosum]|uniref:DUF364 domain-containing protein n=1 Tax=Acetobacterium paludosum TaxID=52693 RepID=A0A923I037_9FIRM|nr:DUF364 domain-containing protein [Acetobacterium paludosum]MBC3889196.1 hypothetical protein [Acetobacterium paludosum]
MNRLDKAYEKILQLYEAEGLSPGCLEGITFSGKWTSVFGGLGQNGMAFNFTGEHSVYGAIDPAPLVELQCFVGKPLINLAEYLSQKEDILHRSVYLAVLNALSAPLNRRERLITRGFSFVNKEQFEFVKEDDFVTVIGAGGVIGNLQKRCKEVHVLDMRNKNTLENLYVGKEICRGPGRLKFHNPEESAALLSQSDIVFMTGCTLVNQTIFDLLPMIKKARVIGVFGPSAMILADFLSDLGVNYIQTVCITDSEAMKEWMLNGFGMKIPEIMMENYLIKICKEGEIS